jgi:hypothetical protein
MSARPGRIRAVHTVPLARPRGPDARVGPQFATLTDALWRAIQPEWQQSIAATTAA